MMDPFSPPQITPIAPAIPPTLHMFDPFVPVAASPPAPQLEDPFGSTTFPFDSTKGNAQVTVASEPPIKSVSSIMDELEANDINDVFGLGTSVSYTAASAAPASHRAPTSTAATTARSSSLLYFSDSGDSGDEGVVDPRLSAMYASGGCCGDSSGAGFPPPEGGRWSPSLLQQRHESNPRRAPLSTSTPSSESVDQPPAAGVAANLDRTSRDANGGGAGGGEGSVRTGPHQQQQPTQPRAFSCLVRASTRSLVTKDWKHSTFLLHQTALLLFRSPRDVNAYLDLGTSQHRSAERKLLLKRVQLLTRAMTCTRVTTKPYKLRHDHRPETQQQQPPHSTGRESRKNDGGGVATVVNLPHFTLEEQRDYGRVTVAKFASEDTSLLDVLRTTLVAAIRTKRHGANIGQPTQAQQQQQQQQQKVRAATLASGGTRDGAVASERHGGGGSGSNGGGSVGKNQRRSSASATEFSRYSIDDGSNAGRRSVSKGKIDEDRTTSSRTTSSSPSSLPVRTNANNPHSRWVS